jgi:purine nucleosidase
MLERKKYLFDCDNTMGLRFREVDDGLTLLYLLGCPEVDLLGVTTTFGNGTINEVHNQTEKLLKDLGRDDIPLYRGSGSRGQEPTEAAHFLVKTAASYPGEINVLATGPLGNLRAASELDPHFFGNINQIACMGGCFQPIRVGWRNVPELNFSADPEAAYAVLNAPCPITMLNAHVCQQASFGWSDLRRIKFMGSRVQSILRNWLISGAFYWGLFEFYLWDLLPAVYLTYPELFDDHWVWVCSTTKELEQGKLVLSPEGNGARVNMPTQITDVHRFKEILMVSWARLVNGFGN